MSHTLVADTLRRRRTEFVLHRLHGASDIAMLRQVAGEFAMPLILSTVVAVPLAALLGQRYLAGFVDRVGSGTGIAVPLLAACVVMTCITGVAVLRHLRQALALQPVEALTGC